jgi:hypothetical protein
MLLFREDHNAVLFGIINITNLKILIKIVQAIFEKNTSWPSLVAGPLLEFRQVYDVLAYKILFGALASINYYNSIRIGEAIFNKIYISPFGS